MSVIANIRTRLGRTDYCKPFSIRDFLVCGKRDAVDKAFSRLVSDGSIQRIARGMYVRISPINGVPEIEPEQVIKVMTTTAGASFLTSERNALKSLGIPCDKSASDVFYSNGLAKEFRYKNKSMKIRRVSNRKISVPNDRIGLAFLVLWQCQSKKAVLKRLNQLNTALSDSEYSRLLGLRPKMYGWISDAIYQFEEARIVT